MKNCPNCGAQIEDDSRFCTECGKEIIQANVCPHCGASVGGDDAFCQSCGKSLNEEIAPYSQPQNTCPHCGASMNEGDVFCQECGKKPTDTVEEQHEETVEYEETESKSAFKRYLPYILCAFVVLALIGYFISNGSNDPSNPNGNEEQTTDSLIEKVEAKMPNGGADYTEEDIKNSLESMYKEIFTSIENEVFTSNENEDFDTKYTSTDYQSLLNKAYEVSTDGMVLDADHWVQGQDYDKPSMNVISVKKESDNKAVAKISIQPYHGDTNKHLVRLILLFENNKWVVDDFVSLWDGEEHSEKAYLKKYIEDSQQLSSEGALSDNPNSKFVGRWSYYIVSDGQKLKVHTAIINSDISARWITYLPDGSVITSMDFRQCVFADGFVYFTNNGDITAKMTPRFKVGSDGLEDDGDNIVEKE